MIRRLKNLLLRPICFLLFLVVIDFAVGQTWISTSLTTVQAGSVACSGDGKTLVAASSAPPHSFLYVSTNEGGIWRFGGTLANWTSVACSADGTTLIAAGLNTGIYISHNLGSTWTLLSGAPVGAWMSIASSSNGTVLIGTISNSLLYVSTNAGTSWTPATGLANWGSVACSADGSKMAAVSNGVISISRNIGTTWTEATNGPVGAVSLACSADGTFLSAVSNNGIYLSFDEGLTWISATNAPALPWQTVTCSADGSKVVAAANGDSIYSTTNAGTSWQSNNAPVAQWSGVASSGDGTRMVAVSDLGVYVLPNPSLGIGQVVSPPSVSPSNTLTLTITVTNFGPGDASNVVVTELISQNSASFLSSTPSWTSNSGETLTFDLGLMTNGATASISIQATGLRLGLWEITATVSSGFLTNDVSTATFGVGLPGSQGWTTTTAPNLSWRRIACSADGSRLVAVASSSGPVPIYLSTDAGRTWNSTSSPRLINNWDCVASSADGVRLIAGESGPSQLYISTNSGLNWNATGPQAEWLDLASSADGRVLLAGNFGQNPFLSTNYGATWNPTALGGYWAPVASSSDGSKLMASTEGVLYTSTNTGTTWVAVTNLPIPISAMACSGDGNKIVVTPSLNGVNTNTSIYISSDFGATWMAATNAPAPYQGWAAVTSSADGNRLVVADNNGFVFRSSDSGNTWIQAVAPGAVWKCVTSSADGNTVAAAGDGRIYVSRLPSLWLTTSSVSQLIVSWPPPAWGFRLQQNVGLLRSNWTDIVSPVFDDANGRHVIFNPTASSVLFRLAQ